MSDSDNKAISVQVQLDLDLPTGTELGNNSVQIAYLEITRAASSLINL